MWAVCDVYNVEASILAGDNSTATIPDDGGSLLQTMLRICYALLHLMYPIHLLVHTRTLYTSWWATIAIVLNFRRSVPRGQNYVTVNRVIVTTNQDAHATCIHVQGRVHVFFYVCMLSTVSFKHEQSNCPNLNSIK